MCINVLTFRCVLVLEIICMPIYLSMMHGEMHEFSCPYDIHYICGMTITYNSALPCICKRTSH